MSKMFRLYDDNDDNDDNDENGVGEVFVVDDVSEEVNTISLRSTEDDGCIFMSLTAFGHAVAVGTIEIYADDEDTE